MKNNRKIEIAEAGAAIAVTMATLFIAFGLSWIVTCGVVKLITMCFGLTFTWGTATGIWLIIFVLRLSLFTITKK